MKRAVDRAFIHGVSVRNGDDLDAARGIAIGSLLGAIAWLIVLLALSMIISFGCAGSPG